jgi:RadC-like JAB domain
MDVFSNLHGLSDSKRSSQDHEEEAKVLSAAEEIMRKRIFRMGALNSPAQARDFLRMRLGHLPHEEFHAIWLDSRHQILGVDRLFIGTLDSSQVHVREVIRYALQRNAAAVIFAHNHPSGCVDPQRVGSLDYPATRVNTSTNRRSAVGSFCHWCKRCVQHGGTRNALALKVFLLSIRIFSPSIFYWMSMPKLGMRVV